MTGRRKGYAPIPAYGKLTARTAVAVLALIVCARAMTGTADAPKRPSRAARMVTGLTASSRSAIIAPLRAGRIVSLPVAEGQTVRAGDLLVMLDDEAQAARTEMARLTAESALHVELAKVRWVDAQRESKHLQALAGSHQAAPDELADALTRLETARLEYELAGLRQKKAIQAYVYERRILEQFHLRAPFDGYVAAHLKRAGQTVDSMAGVIQLATLDPLEVSLDCPLALAPFIRTGDRYEVRPVHKNWSPRVGVVQFSSRVADGASQTFKVRLRVPNADGVWLSGLKVEVDFRSR